MELSYWEKEFMCQYDYIVIGAGIVGIQTAIRLQEKVKNAKIVILERGFFPSGASTKNAGFAATGSLGELASDRQNMSKEAVISLFCKRKSGLDYLRKQLGDKNIGYIADGSHELLTLKEAPILDAINPFNKLLGEALKTKVPVFRHSDERLAQFGFNQQQFHHCIENSTEAGINTGLLMNSLITYATRLGINIRTGASVEKIEQIGQKVSVTIKSPLNNLASINLNAKEVFVCTNAFSSVFFPEIQLTPGRGQVLITSPIPDLPFKGIFHFDEGYYYFRNINNRILIGGGRNLDFKTEETTEIEINETIQNELIRQLKTNLAPGIPFSIDQQWAGIMAFGPDKEPIIAHKSDRIHAAFRLSGIGVAVGSILAHELVASAGIT